MDRAVRAQCADAVLMIRPAAFGANPQTAATNPFQGSSNADVSNLARAESDALAAQLAAADVEVIVVEDTPDPPKPDACFPNNWLSLHHDGTAVLYPLLAPNRRLERRPEILEVLRARGFELRRRLDLTAWEEEQRFLEGTGSVVLDHVAGVAYACHSARSDLHPLEQFCNALGYQPYWFDALGPDGAPVYHTNVLMSLGEGFAVACFQAIPDPATQDGLRESLSASGRTLISLTLAQLQAFAGNLLALSTRRGNQVIAMSGTAWASFGNAQRRTLESLGQIVVAEVPTIERYGGGSVRCMLAEVFLPRTGRP